MTTLNMCLGKATDKDIWTFVSWNAASPEGITVITLALNEGGAFNTSVEQYYIGVSTHNKIVFKDHTDEYISLNDFEHLTIDSNRLGFEKEKLPIFMTRIKENSESFEVNVDLENVDDNYDFSRDEDAQ